MGGAVREEVVVVVVVVANGLWLLEVPTAMFQCGERPHCLQPLTQPLLPMGRLLSHHCCGIGCINPESTQ
jgi:hypothetical protein